MSQGKVWLVGAGPSDVGLFTLKGKEVLEKAEVVVYDALVGHGVLAMVPKHAELIDVGKLVLASPPAVHVLKVAEDKKRQRIYVAKMGGFSDSANYEFIAEFESKKLTGNYVEFMRGKKRYSDKDIIVQEVLVSKTPQSETITKGKVVSVITVLGEELPVDEYEFK